MDHKKRDESTNRDQTEMYARLERREVLAMIGFGGVALCVSSALAAAASDKGVVAPTGTTTQTCNLPPCGTPPDANSDVTPFGGLAKFISVLAVDSANGRKYRREFNVCPEKYLAYYSVTPAETAQLLAFSPDDAFVYLGTYLPYPPTPQNQDKWKTYNKLSYETRTFWDNWENYSIKDVYDDPQDCILPEQVQYGHPITRIRMVETAPLGGGSFQLTIRGEGILKTVTAADAKVIPNGGGTEIPVTDLKFDECSTFRCSKLMVNAALTVNSQYIVKINISGLERTSPVFKVT